MKTGIIIAIIVCVLIACCLFTQESDQSSDEA